MSVNILSQPNGYAVVNYQPELFQQVQYFIRRTIVLLGALDSDSFVNRYPPPKKAECLNPKQIWQAEKNIIYA
jgi:hypothetical protein